MARSLVVSLSLFLALGCGGDDSSSNPDAAPSFDAGPVLAVTFTPTSADFESTYVGETRGPATFSAENTGEGPISGLTATLAGTDAADFSIDASDCDSLAVGATCTLTVSFTPTAGQARAGSLVLSAGGNDWSATLSGVAVNPADYNRAFVTKATYATNLGSAQAYDTKCNEAATAAGINNATNDAYVAWISSTTSNAITRLGAARGFFRTDGLPFADDLLAGELFNSLDVDEDGNSVPTDTAVMTATGADGLVESSNCDDWAGTGLIDGGRAGFGPSLWTDYFNGNCSIERAIYCFETTNTAELVLPRPEGSLIYVTNTPFVVGGGTTPDAACEASKPAGAGTVKALIAYQTTAASALLSDTTTYVRPDGTPVGTGAQLKAETPLTGIWQQGNGNYISFLYGAWTGSASINDLGSTNTCADWTNDTTSTYRGQITATDDDFWSVTGTLDCDLANGYLYCIETD